MKSLAVGFAISLLLLLGRDSSAEPTIKVGSKIFTESYILAEIVAQTIEEVGEVKVERRLGLGATGIAFASLKGAEIDIYPEYTGTIAELFFKNREAEGIAGLNSQLGALGLRVDVPFGFNNTYALAVRETLANKMNLRNMSDLKLHPEIRAGFTHEFLKRDDGFDALSKFYGLQLKNFVGMEHSLLYQSLEDEKIDLVEIYSTDAKVKKYGLRVLEDDRHFFRSYKAILFFRSELLEKYPKTMMALKRLENRISETQMVNLNALVEIDHMSFADAASTFLKKSTRSSRFSWSVLAMRAKEHLYLVFLSLIMAMLIGIPIGFCASRFNWLGPALIAGVGLLQTIPSLALLCFFIPIFGIGYLPSVMALFLYALLPIVRNTYLGFQQVDSRLIESAKTLALNPWQIFSRVELPLASPAIMAGIKTSAVINVGTATLAAFIGAGGFGALIVTGLVLNDSQLILQGAIPSALFALCVHGFFEMVSLIAVPKALR